MADMRIDIFTDGNKVSAAYSHKLFSCFRLTCFNIAGPEMKRVKYLTAFAWKNWFYISNVFANRCNQISSELGFSQFQAGYFLAT